LPIERNADPDLINLGNLTARLTDAYDDYQGSHYTRLTLQLPALVTDVNDAVQSLTGDDQRRAQLIAASVHQLCGVYLPKLGETDLALLSAGKGLELAQLGDESATIGSLYRIVSYALASLGEHDQAVALASKAIERLEPRLTRPDASGLDLSVYGMLHLVAGRAAAQCDNSSESDKHLNAGARIAERVGGDRNYGWTGFGPTNVTIHRTTCAVELGNLQRAVAIGPGLDTSGLPVERRGRHAIESARALLGIGRTNDAVDLLAEAERFAPEQIRHHHQSREVIRRAIRGRHPNGTAMSLAGRMRIAEL
jgi:tetratricopeptide (TPR) repeat protein